MADSQGKFVWYELLTTDMAAAEKFYRGVLGWSAREAGAPGMSHTLFSDGEVGAAGMLTLPKAAKDMGATPHWTGYIAVDDVDAYARKVTEAGGRIYAPATDIRVSDVSPPRAIRTAPTSSFSNRCRACGRR
jgi:predicted enzyme related to lactoylglutathione lyase